MQAYRSIVSTVVLLLLSAGAVPAQDDVVMRAMRDELARSMAELQLKELERPYFIAYRVNELDGVSASASFGSLTSSSENRTRMLSVEVRVGDYAFDNTNFVGFPSFSRSQIGQTFGGVASLPLDDDYGEIRRQLWLTTDSVYKQALADLAKKNAVLQNRTRTDELADFSREEAVSVVIESPTAGISLSDARRLTKELSGLFKEMPDIFTSAVRISASTLRTRYCNSEGTTVSGTIPRLSLEASARTQASDGMPLEDHLALYGRTFADLPSPEELEVKIRAFGSIFASMSIRTTSSIPKLDASATRSPNCCSAHSRISSVGLDSSASPSISSFTASSMRPSLLNVLRHLPARCQTPSCSPPHNKCLTPS